MNQDCNANNIKYKIKSPSKLNSTSFVDSMLYRKQVRCFICRNNASGSEINDKGIINRWERIYLEEGLAVEHRGRKNTGRLFGVTSSVGGFYEG